MLRPFKSILRELKKIIFYFKFIIRNIITDKLLTKILL